MALPSAAMALAQEAARQASERARANPFEADVVPARPPLWHLLTTDPARESLAASHLVARRFGIYLPTFGADITLPGGDSLGKAGKPLFPGYLFVFVWDVFRHWRRIHGCPGVQHVVTRDSDPVIVPDEVIGEIRLLEAFNGELARLDCRTGRRAYRRRRQARQREQEERRARREGQQIRIYPKASRFAAFEPLDDAGRIGALNRVLGLSSNAP